MVLVPLIVFYLYDDVAHVLTGLLLGTGKLDLVGLGSSLQSLFVTKASVVLRLGAVMILSEKWVRARRAAKRAAVLDSPAVQLKAYVYCFVSYAYLFTYAIWRILNLQSRKLMFLRCILRSALLHSPAASLAPSRSPCGPRNATNAMRTSKPHALHASIYFQAETALDTISRQTAYKKSTHSHSHHILSACLPSPSPSPSPSSLTSLDSELLLLEKAVTGSSAAASRDPFNKPPPAQNLADLEARIDALERTLGHRVPAGEPSEFSFWGSGNEGAGEEARARAAASKIEGLRKMIVGH